MLGSLLGNGGERRPNGSGTEGTHTVRRFAWVILIAATFGLLTQARAEVRVVSPYGALKGHPGHLRTLAFSPDGRLVVGGGGGTDHSLRLWDVQSGKIIRAFTGHEYEPFSVSFTRDGERILSAGLDDTLKLWDVATGRLLTSISFAVSGILNAALTADGRYAVAAGQTSFVEIRDAQSGALARRLAGPPAETLSAMALSPDSRLVAAGGRQHVLHVYSFDSGALQWSKRAHGGIIKAIAFSPDGQYIATGGEDPSIRLWNAADGAPVRSFEGHGKWSQSLAFSADGRSLISSGRDEEVHVWDVETAVLTAKLRATKGASTGAIFSPDGRTAASASGKTLELYSLAGPAPTFISPPEFDEPPVVTSPVLTIKVDRLFANAVAHSTDGRYLFAGGEDGTFGMWDAASGQLIRRFRGHTAFVQNVRAVADGRRVMSSSIDKTLKLWDVQSGRVLRTYRGHTQNVATLKLAPDGMRALSVSTDGSMRLWNIDSGAEIRRFRIDGLAATFSPDALQIAAGSSTIRVIDTARGSTIRTLPGKESFGHALAFTPDGRHVISGGQDRILNFWDTETATIVHSLPPFDTTINDIVITPVSRLLLVAQSAELAVLDLASRRILRTYDSHNFHAISAAPDGQSFASVGSDGLLKVWSLDGVAPPLHLVYRQSPPAPAAPRVAAPSPEAAPAIAGQLQLSFRPHQGLINAVTFSPNGSRIASASYEGIVQISDARTGALVRTLKGHKARVNTVAFSPDGSRIVSGGGGIEGGRLAEEVRDEHLRLWDIAAGRAFQTFGRHGDAVDGIAFAPDGQHILSAGRRVRLWRVSDGRLVRTFNAGAETVAFSPDGRRFVADSRRTDNVLRLRDIDTGNVVRSFRGHTSIILSVAFSSDGALIASGSDDGSIRLWDANSGALLRTLSGSRARVVSVAFSPDARLIVSGSLDGAVRLWDTATGQNVQSFTTGSTSNLPVAFAPDGQRIAAATDGGEVKIWAISVSSSAR